MSRRLFNDTEWTPEARRLMGDVHKALESILIEGEEGGEIDLRDFHFIATSAISDLVSHRSIRRRLSPTQKQRGERGTQGGEWSGEELLTPEQLASLEA